MPISKSPIGFHVFLFFPLLTFFVFYFLFPTVAFAVTQKEGMSLAEAKEYINEQIMRGYFPIKIETYPSYITFQVYWRVRVVPFPKTSNFDCRWLVSATQDAYDKAKVDYKDHFLIYHQEPVGYGHNAIWVKNELVSHDFSNARVIEAPYSVASEDLALRIAEHLLGKAEGAPLSAFLKYVLGSPFKAISFLKNAFTIYWSVYKYENPLTLIPVTPITKQDGSDFVGRGACPGGKISGIIILDLVREASSDVDPANLNDLILSSKYYTKTKDHMTVLKKDEIRTLSKERYYYITPKISIKSPSKSEPNYPSVEPFKLDAITKDDSNSRWSWGRTSQVYFGTCPVDMAPIVNLLHDDVQGGQILFFDNFNSENGGVGAINYNGFINWNVTSGSVDLTSGQGGDGIFVDLDGSTSQNGTLTSKQNFNFESGKSYTLSFSLAASQNISTSTVSVKVASGTLLNEVVTLSRQTPFVFIDYSHTFIGNGTSGRLSFEDGGSGVNTGMHLDNVKLTVGSP